MLKMTILISDKSKIAFLLLKINIRPEPGREHSVKLNWTYFWSHCRKMAKEVNAKKGGASSTPKTAHAAHTKLLRDYSFQVIAAYKKTRMGGE